MEIEPVSFSSTTSAKHQWLDLWAQKLQTKPQRREQSDDETSFAPGPSETDGVDVELTKHAATGAQVVRMVESETGQVLSEIPHRQVLDLVADLIEQNEVRGGGDDGQH